MLMELKELSEDALKILFGTLWQTISHGYVIDYDVAKNALSLVLHAYKGPLEIEKEFDFFSKEWLFEFFSKVINDIGHFKCVFTRDILWLCPKTLPTDVVEFCTSLNIDLRSYKEFLTTLSRFFTEHEILHGERYPFKAWASIPFKLARDWKICKKIDNGKIGLKLEDDWGAEFEAYVVEMPCDPKKLVPYIIVAFGKLRGDREYMIYDSFCKESPEEESVKVSLSSYVMKILEEIESFEERNELMAEALFCMLRSFKVTSLPPKRFLAAVVENIVPPFGSMYETKRKLQIGFSQLLNLAWPCYVGVTILQQRFLLKRRVLTLDLSITIFPSVFGSSVERKVAEYLARCSFHSEFRKRPMEHVCKHVFERKFGVGSWIVKALVSMLGLSEEK